MQTVSDLSEAELIERIRQQLPVPPDWVVVGIGDDAAVVAPARNRLEVLTVDAIVEGVHFDRRFTPPGAVGHRALAVNLSDLAAMGAEPRLALLSLALPGDLVSEDFNQMIGGLAAVARQHRVHVVGGNLTRSPGPLMIDVTLSGVVKTRQVLTRGGARPGDHLYLTGSIGGAAAGLQMLQSSDTPAAHDARRSEACVMRYFYPEPRTRVGLLLGRNRAATACVDLSDGLADAARRIAEASGVGVEIDADAVPVEPDALKWFAARQAEPLSAAMSGGDDYELLFAVRPRTRKRLAAALHHGHVPITRIGLCTADRAIVVHRGAVREAISGGYTHFR
jgi:thiamine-monophosphate kinase